MNNQVKILFGISIFVVVAFIGVLVYSFFSSRSIPANPSTLPTPSASSGSKPVNKNNLTPLQKTVVGKPFSTQSKGLGTPLSTQTLPNGATKYEYKSVQAIRRDEVITKNGVVTSETTITQTGKYGPLPRLASYEALYGKPEEIVRGNKIFGKFADAHIYASQGVMLIVNRFTTEVYEIHRFLPISLDEYKKTYPGYIEVVIDQGV